ncbi:MAG: hypothetical protein A4E51_01261 [Methanosaeta sp. PtaU1.Bin055]|nr:MAG: hypothetical protein A4E51_01261 [Methanosaeta sp. PtaU1.Bin055]
MISWAQGQAVIPTTSAPTSFLTWPALATASAKMSTTSCPAVLVTGELLSTMYSLFIFTSARVAYSCLDKTRRAISPQSSSMT